MIFQNYKKWNTLTNKIIFNKLLFYINLSEEVIVIEVICKISPIRSFCVRFDSSQQLFPIETLILFIDKKQKFTKSGKKPFSKTIKLIHLFPESL